MNLGIVFLVVVLAIVCAAGIIALVVMSKIRRLSRNMFGTDSLLEGLKAQEERIAETPKSLPGMTKIYLPQIQKDFPEFSLAEFTQRSESQLKEVLAAVENQDLALLTGASRELSRQVSLWIEDDKRQHVREQFQNIGIHQTVISRYEKSAGCCTIKFQSAVEYWYKKWNPEGKTPGNADRVQARYEMEWMYVQDVEKLPQHIRAIGMNCPNCGAAIKNLGAKFCEYCGTAVEPISTRIWALNRIEEC